MPKLKLGAVVSVSVAGLVTGCANPYSNAPLRKTPSVSYQFQDWLVARELGDEMIVLSFSGGGVRAAALAESVLDKLVQMRLQDRIALISSTSGGSVTAGFVAARGTEDLSAFRSTFLYHGNLRDLVPRWVPGFLPGGTNRSATFADYLDERLFPGSTRVRYGELLDRWTTARSPFVVLNATDASNGRTFEFTQQSFSALCSDQSAFRLSEAIAASASFPFLMNGITLRNHWDDAACKTLSPIGSSFDDRYKSDDYSGRFLNLEQFTADRHVHSLKYSYSDAPRFRDIQYVHLLDGGLSDNLAVRALLRIFSENVDTLKKKRIRKILLIQVNAKGDAPREALDLSSSSPSWPQVFRSVAFNPIDVATTLSSHIASKYWVALREDYGKAGLAGAEDIAIYPVAVDFDQMHPDSSDQKPVQAIATTWSLSSQQVDLVRKTGADLLLGHPCFKQFMRDRAKRNHETGNLRDENLCRGIVGLGALTPDTRVAVAPSPPPPPPPAPAASPPPAPPSPPAPVSEKVTFAADAFFDTDRATLKQEGLAKLDDLAAKALGVRLEVIIVVGHTDSTGSKDHNDRLGLRRAVSVKTYLVAKGIQSERIYIESKGASQPVADNRTAEGRAKNRRAEIEVVGSRGR